MTEFVRKTTAKSSDVRLWPNPAVRPGMANPNGKMPQLATVNRTQTIALPGPGTSHIDSNVRLLRFIFLAKAQVNFFAMLKIFEFIMFPFLRLLPTNRRIGVGCVQYLN